MKEYTMLRTYKAVLKGNRLEWSADAPKHLQSEHAVPVYVTLLDEPLAETANVRQGQRMAAALEQLAGINAVAEIEHPADWQREVRQDRSLPDRKI
jgi:hypothetical protein